MTTPSTQHQTLRRPALQRLALHRVAAVALAVTATLAACSTQPAATDTAAEAAAAPVTTAAPDESSAAAGQPAEVARPTTSVTVHEAPGGAATATVEPVTEFGSARALLVVDRTPGWLEVQLPTRPNGATGWIADEVEVRATTLAVEVDLAARRLTVTDGATPVLDTAVAVGSPDAPTPTGTWYVTDKLDTGDPTGPYGPFALGLSAHSEVHTEFAGGDGQVGIHGTSDPSSIGSPVSQGCIRVPNGVAVALADLLPLGTPVTVR